MIDLRNMLICKVQYSTMEMPRKGYRSITIREEIYQHLMKQYEANREQFLRQGITSFSGFVTKFLYEALDQEKQE